MGDTEQHVTTPPSRAPAGASRSRRWTRRLAVPAGALLVGLLLGAALVAGDPTDSDAYRDLEDDLAASVQERDVLEGELRALEEQAADVERSAVEAAEEATAALASVREWEAREADLTRLAQELEVRAVELDARDTAVAARETAVVTAEAALARAGSSKGSTASAGAGTTSDGGAYRNCTAAREAGAAPVLIGDPGYGPHLDRDGDGVGCE